MYVLVLIITIFFLPYNAGKRSPTLTAYNKPEKSEITLNLGYLIYTLSN